MFVLDIEKLSPLLQFPLSALTFAEGRPVLCNGVRDLDNYERASYRSICETVSFLRSAPD
jgi:hypothetical protein